MPYFTGSIEGGTYRVSNFVPTTYFQDSSNYDWGGNNNPDRTGRTDGYQFYWSPGMKVRFSESLRFNYWKLQVTYDGLLWIDLTSWVPCTLGTYSGIGDGFGSVPTSSIQERIFRHSGHFTSTKANSAYIRLSFYNSDITGEYPTNAMPYLFNYVTVYLANYWSFTSPTTLTATKQAGFKEYRLLGDSMDKENIAFTLSFDNQTTNVPSSSIVINKTFTQCGTNNVTFTLPSYGTSSLSVNVVDLVLSASEITKTNKIGSGGLSLNDCLTMISGDYTVYFTTDGTNYTDVTNNLTYTPLSGWTYQQIYNSNGRLVLNCGYEYQGQLFTKELAVVVGIKKPTSFTVLTNPIGTYYSNYDNTYTGFDFGSTIRVNFNDNNYEDYHVFISGNVYKDEALTQQLSNGDIINNNSISKLYAKATISYGEKTFEVVCEYEIQYTPNTITSLTLISAVEFPLGNNLNNLKNLFINKIRVAYLAGNTEYANMDHVTFENTADMDTSSNGELLSAITQDLTVLFGGSSHTLVDSEDLMTFTSPSTATMSFVEGHEPKTLYKDIVEAIDLSDVQIRVSYNNATYTQLLDWSDLDSSTKLMDESTTPATEVNVSLDDPDIYLNLSLTTAKNYWFVFTFADSFFGSTLTKEAEITVLPNKMPDGIKVVRAFADYKVGDKFLEKETDLDTATKIKLFFDNGNGYDTSEIFLKDDYIGFTVSPAKGTLFKNPNADLTVKISSVLDNSIATEYSITVAPKKITDTSNNAVYAVIWTESFVHEGKTISSSNGKGVLAIVEKKYTHVENDIRVLNSGASLNSDIVIGYITDILDEDTNSKVVMFNDYIPPINGVSNIDVKFPCFNEGSADNINKCHFGILFGTNNATNRLFVSGNPDISNADWHSGEINTANIEGDILKTNGDFSYFADESIMYYGETDNDIIGYDIVSNDKLFVVKTKSDKEKSVYFRTPVTVKAIDASGSEMVGIDGTTLYQEEFALVKGNNSVSGVSPKTIVNFNGDTLFVDSENHLVGLDLEGIVGDSQRYANSRSKYIDEKIKHYDLSKATLWTNNKYLFLAVPGLGVFVTHFETKAEGQYEWWLLTSENPTAFIEVEGTIYFANDKGEVYRFTDNFKDVGVKFIEEGDMLLAINESTEQIAYNSQLGLEDGKHYKMLVRPKKVTQSQWLQEGYKNDIYYQVATIGHTDEFDLKIENDKIVSNSLQFAEGTIIYLGYIGGSTVVINQTSDVFAFGQKYFFKELESTETHEYQLYKEGSNTPFTAAELETLISATICRSVSDQEVDVVELDTTEHTFKLAINGEELNLVVYGQQSRNSIDVEAEIRHYANVEAHYITAPFTMGSLDNFKTIWGFTVTNDTDIPSEVDIAYASNKIPVVDIKTLASLSKASLGLDFNDLDYKKVDFEKTVVPRTYTTYRTLGMQKFICFAFKNYNDTNAVLSAMSVVYTIPFPAYGSN